MAAKQTRKEKVAAQKIQHQNNPAPSSKKKIVPPRKSDSLIRGLNIILIAIVAVFYFNTLSNEYALDDYGVILENDYTKQGTSGIGTILSTGYRTSVTGTDNQLYRPLSKVMFAIEWSISPNSPGLHHFMNIALFALTVVLLFRMLRMYISNSVLIPFVTAALFAIHPIHTEVVSNIKGRDDILCLLFFIVTAIYVLRFTKSKSTRDLAFAGGAFFLSFLSKESAITFLAVIPLMLYFFTDAKKDDYLKTTGTLAAVTILFLIIRWKVLGGNAGAVPVVDNYIAGIDSFITQRTTAIAIAGIYLWKLFVPHPLVCDASLQQIPVYSFGDWQFLVPFVIFLALAAFAFWKIKEKNIAAFGILYFFITFSIVSNIPFLLGTNYGERLLYAPSLGLSIACAYLLAKFLQKHESIAANAIDFLKGNSKAIAVVGALTIAYGFLTINRNSEWHDNEMLYGTDLQKSVNSAKLHYFYANHLTQNDSLAKFKSGSPEWQHRVDTAIVEFSKAIALYPAYTDPIQKLGEMYFLNKQYDSAAYYYRKAIRLNPTNATYRNNFGRMLFTTGNLLEAEYQFKCAIRWSPGYATAYNNLAGTYGTTGANFVRKSQADPSKQNEYGMKAMEYYRKSVEMSLKAISYDPNFIQAYETIAMTYANMGDNANAQKYSSAAQQLKNSGTGH